MSKTIKYFTATWCGPCKAFGPVMNTVSETYPVEKIDVGNNKEIVAEYKISSVPTSIIFEDGVEVNRFVGVRSYEQVMKIISQ